MQPRLERYQQFIENEFIPSLNWNQDYSLAQLSPDLRAKIVNKNFRRIVFTGMGCSAIVSDVIKGFFVVSSNPIHVEVINDYDYRFLFDQSWLTDGATLFIISSYSGHSQEPIEFYNQIKNQTHDIIFLTSGGQLATIAEQDNVSLIRWQLRNSDREYPLFHVPQYFAILLDIFCELKILSTNYEQELAQVAKNLMAHKNELAQQAELLADRLASSEIVCIASPRWYLSLLKLTDMHINEMAMVPIHRNYFHEFGHSEVAVFSNPTQRLAILNFRDVDDDEYTLGKMNRLREQLTNGDIQNKNIQFTEIVIEGKGFFEKFFSTLLLVNYLALELGKRSDITSRELISIVAGNAWYHQTTINAEQNI